MDTGSNTLNHKESRKHSIIIAGAGLIMIILALIIGISDNPPGITLLLLGPGLIIYSFVSNSERTRHLNRPMKLLYWIPRILCIVFLLFTVLFALDVFEESKDPGEIMIALFMHLIPTFVLSAILILTWRWEWIGGILFSLGGILYIIMNTGRFHLMTYAFISGPLLIIGIFFLLNWKYREEFRPRQE